MTYIEQINIEIKNLSNLKLLDEANSNCPEDLGELWLRDFHAATVSQRDFSLAVAKIKESQTSNVTVATIIAIVKKDKSVLREAVTHSFKGWMNQFPGHVGKDAEKIQQKIIIWISELSANNFSSSEYIEIRDSIAKDARFVTRPPEIEDFLQFRKQNQIFDEYSTSESGQSIVAATKRLSKTFDHRYNMRWTKVDMAESNERLEAWIKHFTMFNLSAECIDKASDMCGKMSDFNKFPPSMQDFTIICKLAMCGDDIPGPAEAYLIASGLVKNKTPHPLIIHSMKQLGEFELRNGKINREAFIAVYQNSILDYSVSGELPSSNNAEFAVTDTTDDSGLASKETIVSVIDKLILEVNDEQYY